MQLENIKKGVRGDSRVQEEEKSLKIIKHINKDGNVPVRIQGGVGQMRQSFTKAGTEGPRINPLGSGKGGTRKWGFGGKIQSKASNI